MTGGTIAGIPIMWILMAQANNRRKKRKPVENAYRLGLGDFVIDLVSQQWCRVVKIECVWTAMPELESGNSPTANRRKRDIRLKHHKANKPLLEHKEWYSNRLKCIEDNPNGHGVPKMQKENYISHKVRLLFADGKELTRAVGTGDEFVCVRAPEIFSFDFEQLKELTKNTFRGVKKAAKKKTKKKAKRKATKRAA